MNILSTFVNIYPNLFYIGERFLFNPGTFFFNILNFFRNREHFFYLHKHNFENTFSRKKCYWKEDWRRMVKKEMFASILEKKLMFFFEKQCSWIQECSRNRRICCSLKKSIHVLQQKIKRKKLKNYSCITQKSKQKPRK